MNCCAECTGMKATYLEPSKHLDRLFPGSLHKIKFHIFQNIPKFSIHVSIPLKYKNICELCDRKKDKEKSGKIILNIFVLNEGVIDVFHKKYYIPTVKNCHIV